MKGISENILFVCTYNKMRSKTGEDIYKDDSRFVVKSAGTSENADVKVDEGILAWADHIVVMEGKHEEWIRERYPELASRKSIFCLDIQDNYWHMDPELVILIRAQFEDYYQKKIK